MLSVQDLSVSFGKENILQDVSLTLKRGQILSIIGPNGSGKSTLLKTILGLQKYNNGTISIDKGVKISYLPQYHSINHLLPLTVFDVVAQGIKATKKWIECLSSQETERILSLLDRVGLVNQKDEIFSTLSGGQRQRVLLALSLITEPDFLFLDEPLNALDLSSINIIYNILQELKQNNIGICIVSHDVNTIVTIADHVVLLMHRVKYSGAPALIPQEALHEVFGIHFTILAKDLDCDLCTQTNAEMI